MVWVERFAITLAVCHGIAWPAATDHPIGGQAVLIEALSGVCADLGA
jgi:hypothetical protein